MKTWGFETTLDISGCNHEFICNPDKIKDFNNKLVKLLDMIPYGDPLLVRFGKDDKSGYTLVQLIQTSNITAHFSEDTNCAYINIFSCKDYDGEEASLFTFKFFEGTDMNVSFNPRG